MPTLELPAGSIVETRVFGPHRLPPSGLTDSAPDWEPVDLPSSLATPEGEARAGLEQRRRKRDVPHEALSPGEGLTPGDAWVELIVVAERMAVIEVVHRWVAGADARLDADAVSAHWEPFYGTFGGFEDVVTEGTVLAGKRALWQSPLTTAVSADPSQADAAVRLARGALGNEDAPHLAGAKVVAAMNWDGALAVLSAAGERPALNALMRLVVVDWELHDEARSAARALLLDDGDADQRVEVIRSTLRRFNVALSLLDPTWFCYQESDRAFVELCWTGWKRHEEHTRTLAAIERLDRVYALEADAQKQVMAQRGRERDERLQRVVGWLGLLGVASTVAGILGTVDYSNVLLDHGGRIAWIVGSAGVALAAFFWFDRRPPS